MSDRLLNTAFFLLIVATVAAMVFVYHLPQP